VRFIRTIEALLRQTTAIYVTHRLDEIPAGIDRVLQLSGGTAQHSRPRR
jgi:ABC-type molybdenum transport system ATPase subunit/photorepair protein PhrA